MSRNCLISVLFVALGSTACVSEIVGRHDGGNAAEAAAEARPQPPDADVAVGTEAGPDRQPATDAGPVDGVAPDSAPVEGGVTLCPSGQPPQLADTSAVELYEALAAKDFLLINVAGPPSIPQTDAVLSYSDTAQLVAFIGSDLDTRVVLYCQSGGRSTAAGNALTARGYCAIRQLAGGKSAWTAAGYPLE